MIAIPLMMYGESFILQIFISPWKGSTKRKRREKWAYLLTTNDTFVDKYTNLLNILFIICLFFAVKAPCIGRWKWSRYWHTWTRWTSLFLKSFINNLFIMKSTDLSCDCLIGSTSRPYNKICIHFVDTMLENHFLRCNMTDFPENIVKCPLKGAFCGI